MEEYNRKRGVIKAQLTRLKTYVDSVALDDVNNPEILGQLTARSSKLELIWKSFDEIQSSIENVQLVLDNERSAFEEAYFNCESKFYQLISKCKAALKVASESPVAGPSNSTAQPESRDTTNIANIRLPTINIPTFDGTLTDWLNFKSTFEGVIHNHTSISDTQKFVYLRSALKGDAITLIQGLEPSDSNYRIAWDLLKSRFDNKQALINHHIRVIMDIPHMHKETLSDLRLLHNIALRNVKSLLSLYEDVKHWDMILIHILANKLDNWGRKEWEKEAVNFELPTLDLFFKFILNKCVILQNSETNKFTLSKPTFNKPHIQRSFAVQRADICPFCSQTHALYQCQRFKDLPIHERWNVAKKLQICSNCLRGVHSLDNCKFGNCKLCNRKHNSLLHQPENNTCNNIIRQVSQVTLNSNENAPSVAQHSLSDNQIHDSTYSVHIAQHYSQEVFLSTVSVVINDSDGNLITARALLDCGSQVSLISESLVNRLNLRTKVIDAAIIGINQVVSKVKYATNIQISSKYDTTFTRVNCLIVPKVSESTKPSSTSFCDWEIPSTVSLADPEFASGGDIDLLLGADVFWKILKHGQIHLPNSPLLQNTIFGWIIAGPMNISHHNTRYRCNFTSLQSIQDNLDSTLTRFWKLEEVPQPTKYMTPDEEYCENYFLNTHTRDEYGQYVVKIPFNEQVQLLGNSHNNALNRFLSLEKRFVKNSELKSEYSKFISQYQELGHMILLTNHVPNQDDGFYLPHHAVFKDNKIRVVFDGSAKTDTGISLNDAQHTGRVDETDIFAILIRFRSYPYVFTTDIVKMFRMIKIANEDQKYQRIIWRDSSDESLSYFQLSTVTYGTRSAPHLAIRALRQLAFDVQVTHPQVSKLILENKYVDDILGGASSLEEAQALMQDLSKVFASAGLQLDKWSTNFSNHDNNLDLGNLDSDKKILGVLWNSKQDIFQYYSALNSGTSITKREILSIVARCFDPLGLLAPIIVAGKNILQQLWRSKLEWDEPVPIDIQEQYNQFCKQLKFSRDLKIPRCTIFKDSMNIELHGFADASIKAYGACLYIRSTDANGKSYISLLCSKSKVAPIQTVSIPRLELCAALMLAKLVQYIEQILPFKLNNKVLWTDSTITLHWIRGSPDRWKTFVSHRVSKIQSLTTIDLWRHVNSKDNPADLISRGAFINDANQTLWFEGPVWLKESANQWPLQTLQSIPDLPEKRLNVQTISVVKTHYLFFKYSNLTKLQRVFAYILRFINNVRNKSRFSNNLAVEELDISLKTLILIAQKETFSDEIKSLKLDKSINTKSSLLKLNPFLDDKNILRVGGRLSYSNYAYEKIHPIVLPKGHPLTILIIRHEHMRLMHAGPSLLLASIRERFWPVGGRNTCRTIVKNCVTCFKCSPRNSQPIMSNLPHDRIHSAFPFYNVGIDYAGPFQIKDRKLKFPKLIKAYVCIFVCMATKAVHFELASSLSAEEFICCFHRFISRRGKPSCIYSDNGTNFVGACAEINEIINFLRHSENRFQVELARDNIKWKFNPPAAPNFGGLWEAAVRSMKHHLKRIIKDVHFNYEEFYTIIVQIEGILNSRPLCPLSTDPSDFMTLTPAHFIIGRSITGLPDHDYTDIATNRLNRFQHMQSCIQHFWNRWSSEYLSSLQFRPKWNKNHSKSNQIHVGDLILIHDPQSPPYCWPLGRIQSLHPGKDGTNRVATVRTSTGSLKRPINKLYPLPIEVECLNAGEDVRAIGHDEASRA